MSNTDETQDATFWDFVTEKWYIIVPILLVVIMLFVAIIVYMFMAPTTSPQQPQVVLPGTQATQAPQPPTRVNFPPPVAQTQQVAEPPMPPTRVNFPVAMAPPQQAAAPQAQPATTIILSTQNPHVEPRQIGERIGKLVQKKTIQVANLFKKQKS